MTPIEFIGPLKRPHAKEAFVTRNYTLADLNRDLYEVQHIATRSSATSGTRVGRRAERRWAPHGVPPTVNPNALSLQNGPARARYYHGGRRCLPAHPEQRCRTLWGQREGRLGHAVGAHGAQLHISLPAAAPA